ncbi:MAG: hypothetical protein WCP77_17120 [Roseococcus sp.]
MIRILPLGLMLGLSACAIWPDEGQGGLAELRQPLPTTEVALEQRLACALRRVSVLETASREHGRATGQAGLLRLTATRATRETYGSLPRDAGRTLDRLEQDAASLHQVVGGPALPECT